jgi:hypothetical protein
MDAFRRGVRLCAWRSREEIAVTINLLVLLGKLEAPPGFEPGVEVLQPYLVAGIIEQFDGFPE